MTKKLNVLILCGSQSPEHQVSLLSAKNVLAAIDRERHNVTLVGIEKDGAWNLYDDSDFLSAPDDPKAVALRNPGPEVTLCTRNHMGYLITLGHDAEPIKIDVCFPVLHGAYGEDGAVQGLLKMCNIPVVGCGIAGSSICMDKDTTKRLLCQGGIPNAKWRSVYRETYSPDVCDALTSELGLPLFIKPATLGSSVGVVKVKNGENLNDELIKAFDLDHKVVVEEFVSGREIECAVLDGSPKTASVPGEVIPKREFYSYEAKYIDEDGAELVAPADLPAETTERVQEMALKVFEILECSGMARVDFFLRQDGELIVNEVNTIPGFTKISMYPRLLGLSSIDYTELITRLIALGVASS